MNAADSTSARATLVESIPTGLEDLRGTPLIEYTKDVLVRLVRAAQSTIDLTAMYWSLLPNFETEDKGFTQEKLDEMGAGAGRTLLAALHEAAGRGVRIRILESPGFSAAKPESATLKEAFPEQVEIHSIKMGNWYGGGGIMHQKIWIFDGAHLFLGSANMDWKSITQVKEMGVVVEDCPTLAADATKYFEGWLAFTGLPAQSALVHDAAAGIDRKVPPWSALVPADRRAPSPLDHDRYRTTYNLATPLHVAFGEEHGLVLLTGCPKEVSGPGRSYDGDALVHTIDEARRTVCVSVMDFAPVGLYSRVERGKPPAPAGRIPTDTPVWWPALYSALLAAVMTRKVYVRLLVSKWGHSSGLLDPYLRSLQHAADGGRADKYMVAGQLEIKKFVVPGWDSTEGEKRKYPSHTRVNHTKYIVTERRLNIGTSNMTWDYFTATAGSSFNADHPTLVRTLQEVFNRDWASTYAYRFT